MSKALLKKPSITKFRKILRAAYPDVNTQLCHKNPFELLIATILSAQCTDRQVNAVTPGLFAELPTPEAFVSTSRGKLEKLIHSTGFYRNKARNIMLCCQKLIDRFGGEVPRTLDELVQLPGVGRKTANVVLGAAFGIPGMVVDTHVARISGRIGLTVNKDPVKIESDLMAVIPKREWNSFSLRLIYFGRSVCKARSPECPECPLVKLCLYPGKRI